MKGFMKERVRKKKGLKVVAVVKKEVKLEAGGDLLGSSLAVVKD